MLKNFVYLASSLKEIAASASKAYQKQAPFPHVIIDDFLAYNHAKTLANEFRSIDLKSSPGWSHYEHENTKRWRMENDLYMTGSFRELAWFLNSRIFLLFLESVTGLNSLIGDPYFIGGGLMASEHGGFLNMHADFNWHHKLQLWRHLNFILYLTPDWDSNWGGELVLSSQYDRNITKISPVFNRAVVFNVDDTCIHGQPDPLKTPPHIRRTLFSSFYYSTSKPSQTSEEPHFTKYSIDNSPFASALTL